VLKRLEIFRHANQKLEKAVASSRTLDRVTKLEDQLAAVHKQLETTLVESKTLKLVCVCVCVCVSSTLLTDACDAYSRLAGEHAIAEGSSKHLSCQQ